MKKVKLKTVIMSHLSDAQANPTNTIHINFVKFLIMKYDNVCTSIDADKEYTSFITKFPKFAEQK